MSLEVETDGDGVARIKQDGNTIVSVNEDPAPPHDGEIIVYYPDDPNPRGVFKMGSSPRAPSE